MTNKLEKLLIIREWVDFQMALQNCYHDTARKCHQNIHRMADEFLEEKRISKMYYKKIKRELKKYDIMYKGLDIRKEQKGWNHRAYLITKPHFYE